MMLDFMRNGNLEKMLAVDTSLSILDGTPHTFFQIPFITTLDDICLALAQSQIQQQPWTKHRYGGRCRIFHRQKIP